MADENLTVSVPKEDGAAVEVRYLETEFDTTVLFKTGVKGPDRYTEGSQRRWALREAIIAAEAFVKAAEADLKASE